jgi:hypothetical protein
MDACAFDAFLKQIVHLTRVQCDRVPDGDRRADETFLLESQKDARKLDRPARMGGKASTPGIAKEHVCILMTRDRTGQTCDFVTGRGQVMAAQLEQYLRAVLASDTLLVTDVNNAYQAFARQTGISHASVRTPYLQRAAICPHKIQKAARRRLFNRRERL